MSRFRHARIMLCTLLSALVAGSSLMPHAWSEGKSFTLQAIKKGARPIPQGGWLDLSEVKKPLPAKAHIQEEADPPVREKGIIGLDMKVYRDQYPMVQAVLRGGPAHLKGILPGDRILAVDGFTTLGRSRSDVDAMISDQPGKNVEFTMARDSQVKRITVTVLGVDADSAQAFLNP